ncbi:hypothetical protein HPB51_008741 [Rhipicephalus microplus]|uniref:BEN domain-containing protein n=1 Tax=Rhipicephalus microplus TaxID=6941 RepID=A0A9J6DZM9_RHIMP|nr:hypothetical protein HPB51_008741 [Rhipicephalus microplus]
MRGTPKVTFVVCRDCYRAVVDNLQKCFISLSVADMAKKAFIGKVSRGLGASDELPLFFQVDNQIHLGNGIFLEQEKWAWLLSRPRDSLFCKEATKLLWGVSALHNRSITGAPCRRYVRSENQAPPRRALTPKKLEAVGNAFSKYIAGTPSEAAPIDRLRKMNRYIAEMLNDLNK